MNDSEPFAELAANILALRTRARALAVSIDAAAKAFQVLDAPLAALRLQGLRADHAESLRDLARAHDEAGFRDRAVSLGVPAGELDVVWSGTRRRLGL